MNWLFFLFPFLLYLGIAVQGMSYYLIGILVPSLMFLFHREKISSSFMKLGFLFLAIHVIFPLTNFLVYFFPNHLVDANLYQIQMTWPGILKSNFPSTLFFGGLALVIIGFLSRRSSLALKERPAFISKFEPLKYYLMGLVPASCFMLIMLFYSHFTGLDLHTLFRSKLEYMTKADAFPTGGYRVFGFYGHPLTIAGVALAYVVFLWSIFCSILGSEDKINWEFLFFRNNKLLTLFFLAFITFSNLIFLFLSGGRTASVVGVAFLIAITFFFCIRKKFIVTIIVMALIAIGGVYGAKKLGLLNRIEATTSSLEKNRTLDGGNHRTEFWRTYTHMFLDKPIFGQGSYWLQSGVRDSYYNKLGYGNSPEKFNAHNFYLETLACVGVLGFLWVFIGFAFMYRLLKCQISFRPLGTAFFLAFLANLCHGLTQNIYYDSSVVYIYICLALVLLWESHKFTSS